jgi:hypothetical protein
MQIKKYFVKKIENDVENGFKCLLCDVIICDLAHVSLHWYIFDHNEIKTPFKRKSRHLTTIQI